MSPSRSKLLFGLFAGQILFGLSRLPHAVLWKRWHRIEQMRAKGPLEFHLGFVDLDTREAIRRLREETAKNSVILFHGSWRGPIEFAAPLLYPRVLLSAHRLPDLRLRTFMGRPVGRLDFGGKKEVVLLESTEKKLRLLPERRGK